MRKWEMRNPIEVLIRKGEDCHGCMRLLHYDVLGSSVWYCDSKTAPAKLRKKAPERRCTEWRHKSADRTNLKKGRT